MYLRPALVVTAFIIALTSRVSAAEEYVFRKLLLADSEQKVLSMLSTEGGDTAVAVRDLPLYASPEFSKMVSPFVGKAIDSDTLNGLANAITQYGRAHDRLITKVLIPKQNISDGVLRFAVLIGRYNELSFLGNRWFSQKLLKNELGIKPGDEVRLSTLEAAVNWLNTNPFRQVKVEVKDLADRPGEANLIVGVLDARPYRFAVSYDDSGTKFLGKNRYSAIAQFGNLWDLAHQGSIQLLTTDDPHLFNAVTVDYTIPLPWRHFLQFSGTHVNAHPTFEENLYSQTAKNTTGSVRYRIPLGSGPSSSELFAGLDFKDTNNNVVYGGKQNVSAVALNIFDFIAGYTTVHHDKMGAWLLGATVNLSPGNITSRNTDERFQPAFTHFGRLGAHSRYAVWNLSLQRLQQITQGWELFSRVTFQAASTNLVSDEQLSAGGSGTLRGFDPNALIGDGGYIFNADLQSPTMRYVLPFKKNANLDTRFVVFFDAAEMYYKKHFPVYNIFGRQVGWDDDPLRGLSSAGVGIRMALPNRFSLNFDYGWQITRGALRDGDRGRGHIKVVLAY